MSFNCITKAMKLLHSILETDKLLFTIYHPKNKEKLGMTESKYNLDLFHKCDCSTAFFLAYNDSIYATQTGLVTKKKNC